MVFLEGFPALVFAHTRHLKDPPSTAGLILHQRLHMHGGATRTPYAYA
jgi:hypothetical protein